jgi:hypothetical protein
MEWLRIETVSDRHLIIYGSMRRAGEEVITTPQAAR